MRLATSSHTQSPLTRHNLTVSNRHRCDFRSQTYDFRISLLAIDSFGICQDLILGRPQLNYFITFAHGREELYGVIG